MNKLAPFIALALDGIIVLGLLALVVLASGCATVNHCDRQARATYVQGALVLCQYEG